MSHPGGLIGGTPLDSSFISDFYLEEETNSLLTSKPLFYPLPTLLPQNKQRISLCLCVPGKLAHSYVEKREKENKTIGKSGIKSLGQN